MRLGVWLRLGISIERQRMGEDEREKMRGRRGGGKRNWSEVNE